MGRKPTSAEDRLNRFCNRISMDGKGRCLDNIFM